MSDGPNIVDFYDLDVLPAVMANADQLFPEFDFRLTGKGWQAGSNATDEVINFFGCRPDRILLMKTRPGLFGIPDGQSRQLTQWVMRSHSTVRGENFTAAVTEIAKIAGVDTSPIEAHEMTPEQRAELDSRREQQRKEAKERAEENERIRERKDREAIKHAANLMSKAKQYTQEHGRQLAYDYFKRRGYAPGQDGLLDLPGWVLCIDDVGLKDRRDVGAVIFPRFTEDRTFTGLQRVFVDAKGRPVEVELEDGPTKKATLGRSDGSRCPLGDGYPQGVVVVAEGGETAVAIQISTGFKAEAGISAQGVEEINLDTEHLNSELIKVIIVAGDLDRSHRGQEATRFAADRLRKIYNLPVAELLPSYAMFPELVGADEMPIKGKSVDFDDVLREVGLERMQDAFDDAIERATVDLQYVQEPKGDGHEAVDQDGHREDGWVQKPPPPLLMPKNDLDCAHEYLMSRHLPEGHTSMSMIKMQGRIHHWQSNVWSELGEPKLLDGDIRRWARPYRMRKRIGRDDPPRWDYPLANISKNQVAAVRDAVADEIEVVIGREDFRSQFWITPMVKRDGTFDIDTASWSRRVEDHVSAGLPDPEMILAINNGLIDLNEWIEHQNLEPIDHTPEFFTHSKIDIELPIDEMNEVLSGKGFGGMTGLEALRAYACSLCPLWIKYLTSSFYDEEDAQAAPMTIRELHKFIGNLFTEDLTHQEGNMLLMHGPSGGGKSVCTNVIVKVIGPRSTVSSNIHKLLDTFHMGSWLRKRLAYFADLDVGPRVDRTGALEMLKLILTGDPLSVNQKYRDEIPNHILKTRIIANVNQVPKLPDKGNAMLRRMLVIDWKRSVPKDQRDPNLEAKLSELKSLAGIMILGLIGLIDLKTDGGFIQPKWSEGPLERFADQGSDYPDFIEQCLKITNDRKLNEGVYEDDFITLDELYHARCGYLVSVGTKHMPRMSDLLGEIYPILTAHEWYPTLQCQVQLKDGLSETGYRGLKLTPLGESFARDHKGLNDDNEGSGGSGKSEGFVLNRT